MGSPDLAVFVQVVESGSFTAAAERLELSKAAVSKAVSRLEQRLGARLLNRTTRRLTLTEAGRLLHERGSAALADLAAAERAVLDLSALPRGRLRVTAPAYFGEVFIAPLLPAFCAQWPEVDLAIDFENRLVDLVEEGFDVGIRISTLPDSSLVARTLARTPMVTVASPEYLQRRGRPQHPADLRDHDCMTYSVARTPSEWRYRMPGGDAIDVPVHGRLRTNNDAVLKRAALDGLGLVRFPQLFVQRELDAGTLQPVLADYEVRPLTLSALFPTREQLAPKVRVFVDFLAERFASPG